MSWTDKLFGKKEEPQRRTLTPDEQALERYRYMLRTAPPELIEQAHEEAFEKLTPEQRRLALQELATVTPDGEKASLGEDPRGLARLATRAEMRQPGTMERLFGGMSLGGMRPGGYGMGGVGMSGMGMGMGMGGMLAGGFLSSLAGTVVGSMIAQQFLDHSGFNPAFDADATGLGADLGPDAQALEQGVYEDTDGVDNELGAGDFGGEDLGGDLGDGDFGGMDDMDV